ncbi:hypothetical protein pb186bvf_014168 [Paramecium bursaria]
MKYQIILQKFQYKKQDKKNNHSNHGSRVIIHEFIIKYMVFKRASTENLLNYLIGEKFFYNYFTQGGKYVDMSQLTFILWVNNPHKSTNTDSIQIIIMMDQMIILKSINNSLYFNPMDNKNSLYNWEILTSYKPQYETIIRYFCYLNLVMGLAIASLQFGIQL